MASPSAVPAEAAPPQPTAPPDQPAISSADDGQTRRPRDARLVHLVLSSLGVHSYQERVPLQLLDFAYRYTSSVLSDSLRLSAEGYSSGPSGAGTGKGRGGGGGGGGGATAESGDGSNITATALRQAIASRQDYAFRGPALPKEWMMELAAERNRVALPRVEKSWGAQLPPEKYCLTGTGWNIKEEWESEGEGEEAGGLQKQVNGDEDKAMGGMDGSKDGEREDEEEENFEDVFGGGGDEDREMQDA